MAATFAVVGELFAGGAAEAGLGAAAAGAGDAAFGAATADVLAGAGATAGEAAAAGASAGSGFAGGATAGAVGGSAAGGTVLGTLGTGVATAAAGQLVGAALAPTPKAPKTLAPLAMPDPLAQQQAVQQSIITQMARRGRASTVLTDGGGGKLGG